MMHRLDTVSSLRRSVSGGRWQTIKNRILKERGARCEECGTKRRRLEAHEVWEYYSAEEHVWEDVGSENPETACDRANRLLIEFNAQQEENWRSFFERSK
jgi:hypothetical protein